MSATAEIIVILLLILLNGFFAGAEIAILTSRRSRLEPLAKSGDRGAKLALQLSQDAGRFLSTIQVGITFVGTLAAAFGGAHLAHSLAEWLAESDMRLVSAYRKSIALTLVTLAISFAALVIGELVPKRIALQRAEPIARFVSFPMVIMSRFFRPVVGFLSNVTSAILFVLRVRADAGPKMSAEDIEHLIEAGHAEGVFNMSEKEVALEALQLGDRKVRDIMRPRVDMEALDVDTPQDEVMGAIAMAGFSRIPVYQESLDRIMGFVYIKDVFQQVYLNRPVDLRKLLHPPLFVPDSMTLDRVLEAFQEKKTQLAIVVDEYGGTAGLVTMEDVLEELVGEIHDEHRRDHEQLVVQREDGSWLIDGGLPIHEFVELLQDRLPQLKTPEDISTVSGVVLQHLERIPKVGEKVAWNGIDMEVVDMDGTRIDRILVTLPEPQPTVEEPEPEG
ncbi:MAG: HlyC/CorC family transporter [Planctomyces sp.]|nr:HlyC/CorC family transporter [Planctomyces sp.]